MKKISGIVMMFSLMGLLSVMAQEVKPKQTEIVDLGKGIKLEMALIPAGKFMMGSPETEKNRADDEFQHEVTITKPFYIGKYEVTQEQWKAVMGINPSEIKGAKLPLTNVSWVMCQDFIIDCLLKQSGNTPAEGKQQPFIFLGMKSHQKMRTLVVQI